MEIQTKLNFFLTTTKQVRIIVFYYIHFDNSIDKFIITSKQQY